jgi:hypothetical protein
LLQKYLSLEGNVFSLSSISNSLLHL